MAQVNIKEIDSMDTEHLHTSGYKGLAGALNSKQKRKDTVVASDHLHTSRHKASICPVIVSVGHAEFGATHHDGCNT